MFFDVWIFDRCYPRKRYYSLDDDIDVMMPRLDYDKFISYCSEREEEIAPFKLFENSLISQYPHPIARMSYQRYRVDFDNEKDYGIGLFVDIYPLDGV